MTKRKGRSAEISELVRKLTHEPKTFSSDDVKRLVAIGNEDPAFVHDLIHMDAHLLGVDCPCVNSVLSDHGCHFA